MSSSCSLILLLLINICNIWSAERQLQYYPIFGAKSFQLNLNEDITYGTAAPSVTALDGNIFAIVWASSPKTRNIDYNANINCRLFYMDDDTQAIQLLYQTIKINLLSDKQNFGPQILALSDANNQISESKRFAIVWHCNDINGAFDGIYSKIIRWDYEEQSRDKISITIVSEDESKTETKVNEEIHSIIGNINLSPIFDMSRYVLTWLSWNKQKGNVFEFDIYSKILDNYGAHASNEFVINIPSSKMVSSQRISPLHLSETNTDSDQRSTYFIAVWSVYDDISQVSGIYAKLVNVGGLAQTEDTVTNVINETVMDNGIDIYAYNPSNGEYANHYRNGEPDVTYLMQNYVMIVWNSNQRQIVVGIYYIDLINKKFVNKFMDSMHDIESSVIYAQPKVNTITCYQSNIDYKKFKSIENEIKINKCEISICYHKNTEMFCSFLNVYQNGSNGHISFNKYYENDVQITDENDLFANNTVIQSDLCSWNRYFEDLSNPINGKLLIANQINTDNKGLGIYGTIIQYSNRSLENPTNNAEKVSKNPNTALIIVLVLVFLIFVIGIFCGIHFKNTQNGNRMQIKKEIEAVNKKIINKFNKFNPMSKHRGHISVSGVDSDDSGDQLELANDSNKTKTNVVDSKPLKEIIAQQSKNDKVQFQLSGDSDNSSSTDDTAEIGGGKNTRNLTDSSMSTTDIEL